MDVLWAIWRWWRLCRRHHTFRGVAFIEPPEDPTPAVQAGNLVLLGPKAKAKWLRFQCPCRCGAVIALNLMASHTPRWSVHLHEDGTLTVVPSVDATNCGSHFFIRHNTIQWV